MATRDPATQTDLASLIGDIKARIDNVERSTRQIPQTPATFAAVGPNTEGVFVTTSASNTLIYQLDFVATADWLFFDIFTVANTGAALFTAELGYGPTDTDYSGTAIQFFSETTTSTTNRHTGAIRISDTMGEATLGRVMKMRVYCDISTASSAGARPANGHMLLTADPLDGTYTLFP